MEGSKEYQEFVEKFKPKKTTDDCYTPPGIYEIVKEWACREYAIDPESIVRPFWPGGDYERYDYPDGCTVLDNPPFSTLTKICEFYIDRGIHFFLFAPSLTAFSGKGTCMRMNHIICDCDIVYENGAIVRTSFVTSYGGNVVAQTAPELTKLVNDKVRELRKKDKKERTKYSYPDHVITAAMLQRYAKCGIEMKIRRNECTQIEKLDSQKTHKKKIYGQGLLLSEKAAAGKAAAEKAAAEKAAAEKAAEMVWELSPREWEIVKALGGDGEAK